MRKVEFTDEKGSFRLDDAQEFEQLYFPIASESGMKSALTVNLAGDAKLDQNHFLLEPVSVENLHGNRGTRNFWCVLKDGTLWSATGQSAPQQAWK